MFRQIIIACLVCVLSTAQAQPSEENPLTNEVTCDQELVFAMVVNRHGDRSPDEDELSLSDQQEKILNLTYIEGLEGLTIAGKQRAYHLGKFYRQWYGQDRKHCHKLMSSLYLRDEVAIRSTDKERTKMTIQVAMAAAYPPEHEQQWDEGIGQVWQPVPYTAVPLTEDYLRYYSNCDRFSTLMEEAKRSALCNEFHPYADLIQILMEKTGRNFTEDPLLFQTFFDLLKSTQSLGLDIPSWSKPLLPRLSEAAMLAYKLYYKNDEMKKLGGGVLLNTFIEAADAIIAGKPVLQRLRLFSAHDFNVGALMAVSEVKGDHGIPGYGAVAALELYRLRNGRYTVVPVYLPVAGISPPEELRISGCSSRCDYSRFKDHTQKYRLPEKEFYQLCNIRTEL